MVGIGNSLEPGQIGSWIMTTGARGNHSVLGEITIVQSNCAELPLVILISTHIFFQSTSRKLPTCTPTTNQQDSMLWIARRVIPDFQLVSTRIALKGSISRRLVSWLSRIRTWRGTITVLILFFSYRGNVSYPNLMLWEDRVWSPFPYSVDYDAYAV